MTRRCAAQPPHEAAGPRPTDGGQTSIPEPRPAAYAGALGGSSSGYLYSFLTGLKPQ